LQKLALKPNASSMNVAFTKHIMNALMQIREKKWKQKVSIPKKLEDGWKLAQPCCHGARFQHCTYSYLVDTMIFCLWISSETCELMEKRLDR
jgi:hypothetical protein